MLTAAVVAMVLPFAQAPWPHSPCTGREQIAIDPPGLLAHPAWAAMAAISDPQCRVAVRRDLTEREACMVLTHELGHLAGRRHSPHWWSVMHRIPAMPRRCKHLPDR